MARFAHRPVLVDEALAGLNIQPEGRYVDGTFGRGGHAGAILSRLAPAGRLLAFDRDPEAVAEAERRFGADSRFEVVRGSFTMLERVVLDRGWSHQIDGVFLDLGVSSPQLDDPARGFSFQHDGPLDMRMDPATGRSAAEWLAEVPEGDLARVLKVFGEERFARRIARRIVAARDEASIETTAQLAALIAAAVPTRERGKHPATRSFQAIRIAVNGELEQLEEVLRQAVEVLAPGGRLAVISFHSLEDRMVKRWLRDQARPDPGPPGLPYAPPGAEPRLRLIGKAVRAGEAELADNPRARSATLRIAERLP